MANVRPTALPIHTWVVAYDISDDGRRTRVAKHLEGYGERVQLSVFECRLDESELRRLRAEVRAVTEPREDRIRWYPLCRACKTGVKWQGPGGPLTDDGAYFV
jgi:CRISPR-associated protein Cas2